MDELQNNQILIKPRFAEVDMMRVVHHSRYWIWFEEAKFNFLDKVLGMSNYYLKELPMYLPIIDCHCNYRHAITWDMEVMVETKLELTKAPYINFYYDIYAIEAPSKILATGMTKQAFIDLDFNLKLKTPDLFLNRYDTKAKEMPYAFINKEAILA